MRIVFVLALLLLPLLAAPPARALQRPTGASVSGTVYDSLAGGPLAGADVQFIRADSSGASFVTATDSSGRFAVDYVAEGAWLVGVFHPRLDSLGVALPTVRLALRAGEKAGLTFAIPPRAMLVALFCPDSLRSDEMTVLSGTVRDAVTGASVPRAAVTVRWGVLAVDGGGLVSRTSGGMIRAGADGRFIACNVPAEVALLVSAETDSTRSGVVELKMTSGGIVARDLFVAPSVSTTLSGRVVAPDGSPLLGARVTVIGEADTARTDAMGRFTFSHLRAGTTTLEARALGYAPTQLVFDVRPGRPDRNVAQLTMERALALGYTALPGVRIESETNEMLRRVGFTDRRRGGFGHFLDTKQIEKENAVTTVQLLARLPSTVVVTLSRGNRLYMRTPSGLVCPPTVWVDGQPVSAGETISSNEPGELRGGPEIDLDMFADPSRLAAVEVYRTPMQAPLQYGGTTRSLCGVIVLWRKSGEGDER